MSDARTRSTVLVQTAGIAAATLAAALIMLPGDTASARSRGSVAAGAFDGNWNVVFATRSGNCSQAYSAPFTVIGRRVVSNGGGMVSGGIAANGSLSVQISVGASVASGRGRLAGSSGAGNWSGIIQGDRCSGVWEASRS